MEWESSEKIKTRTGLMGTNDWSRFSSDGREPRTHLEGSLVTKGIGNIFVEMTMVRAVKGNIRENQEQEEQAQSCPTRRRKPQRRIGRASIP